MRKRPLLDFTHRAALCPKDQAALQFLELFRVAK
jgi:hypothetical protein